MPDNMRMLNLLEKQVPKASSACRPAWVRRTYQKWNLISIGVAFGTGSHGF